MQPAQLSSSPFCPQTNNKKQQNLAINLFFPCLQQGYYINVILSSHCKGSKSCLLSSKAKASAVSKAQAALPFIIVFRCFIQSNFVWKELRIQQIHDRNSLRVGSAFSNYRIYQTEFGTPHISYLSSLTVRRNWENS